MTEIPPGILVRRELVNKRLICVGVPISDEVLELGQLPGDQDYIGWTTVDRSILNLHSKRVDCANVTLRDCEIVARKVVRDMNWNGVLFERCTFHGTFRLLSFGIPDAGSDHPSGLANCDLSKARFDYCSLCHVDVDTIRWPDSPHVIFFHPGSHSEEIRSIVPQWPIQGLLQMTAFYDEQVHAVAQSLPFLLQRKDPAEQLERFLEKCRTLDFVRINF